MIKKKTTLKKDWVDGLMHHHRLAENNLFKHVEKWGSGADLVMRLQVRIPL